MAATQRSNRSWQSSEPTPPARRKEQVYNDFLDKADAYATRTNQVRICLEKVRAAAPPGGPFTVDAECSKNVADLAQLRFEFQRARNAVFVHGSTAAEDQAGVIAGYLPPAVGGDPVNGLPELGPEVANYDRATFNQMYRAFNKVTRCEIPAEPRPGCEE